MIVKHKFRDKKFDDFKNKIPDNTDKFWCPQDIKFSKIQSNSCFDFQHFIDQNSAFNELETDASVPKFKDKLIRTISVLAHPNERQRLVLNRWFDAYIIMFNETIKFIKSKFNSRDLSTVKHMKIKVAKLFRDMKDNDKCVKTMMTDIEKIRKNLVKLRTKRKLEKNDKKKDNTKNKAKSKIKTKIKTKISTESKIKELENQLKVSKIELVELNKSLHMKTMNHNKAKNISNRFENNIQKFLDYKFLRTKKLKEIRDRIQKNSQIKHEKRKMEIHAHTLDTAIKNACSTYKSCVTNFLDGNIKRFRVKYWKLNRKNKLIELEKSTIAQYNDIPKNKKKSSTEDSTKPRYTIAPKILGMMKYSRDGKDYELKLGTIFVRYDSDSGKYKIDVPDEIKQKELNQNNRTVSLDPGIRTFMTGMSNNEVMKFGTNIFDKVKSYIKRINNAKQTIQDNNRIRGIETKYNSKIKRLVDDMHWKIANNLTSKYKTVLIGDMSSKQICSYNNKILDGLTKQAVMQMNYYIFRKRLEYKCAVNKVEYKEIDEKYTSKMCSKCGWCDEKLGGSKTFTCQVCKLHIDRDVNACRNILIKGLKIK